MRKMRGLSLLEVVIASFIFTVVLSGVTLSWQLHEKALRAYRNRNTARLVAQTNMELFLAKGYTGLLPFALYAADPNQFSATEQASMALELERELSMLRSVDHVEVQTGFHVSTRVTQNPAETLLELRTHISYDDQGKERNLKLATTVFRSH